MAKYSIQDTSLIAIGDAIRNKSGEHTRIETETYMKTIPETIISKSPSAINAYEHSGYYPVGTVIDVIRFPGASSIYIDCAVEVYNKEGKEYAQVAAGEYDDTNFPVDEAEKIYCTRTDTSSFYWATKQMTFENTDVVTLRFVGSYQVVPLVGYYAECRAFDADGNPMGEYQVEAEREVEVKNTLTPAQMATEIEELPTLNISAEICEWKGSLTYTLSEDRFSWFINDFGDKISTKDVSNLSYFASNAKTLEEIPFDINLYQECKNLSFAFNECRNLKTAPTIRGTLSAPTGNYSGVLNLSTLFCGCNNLREIPYDYFRQFGGEEFWEASKLYYGNRDSIFENCFSLRELPDISMLINNVSSYGCLYSDLVRSCYALNGIYNLPILPISFTFGSTAFSHIRAKDLIFETNEDGSAKTAANWSVVNLDLGTYPIGITINRANVLNYNSGITADKEVTDNATYQALKDDPDWFTCKYDYSRYNHDSAVRTINSLPDVTGGSNNIITFRGQCGALTDGGAINTLTEEEIAVAAAKGWTVSFK